LSNRPARVEQITGKSLMRPTGIYLDRGEPALAAPVKK
jgi:hypothetical protein